MINTIPVFRSVHSATVFKNEIIKNNCNHLSKKQWSLLNDKKQTSANICEAIFHTKLEYEEEPITKNNYEEIFEENKEED
jgi:hypothetical protein